MQRRSSGTDAQATRLSRRCRGKEGEGRMPAALQVRTPTPTRRGEARTLPLALPPPRRSRRPVPGRSRSLTLLPCGGRVPPAPGCARLDTAAGHGQAWARCATLAPGRGTITGELGRFSRRRAQVWRARRGAEGDASGSAPARRSPAARRPRGP